MKLLIRREFFHERRKKKNDYKRFMKYFKSFSSKLKTNCLSIFYFMFSSTKSNQVIMTINDAIAKI